MLVRYWNTLLTTLLATLASSAHGAVTVSSHATQNMSCSADICSPTATKAILNVGDLESLLASGNVTVTTSGSSIQANDIRVAAPLTWSASTTLTLTANVAITISKPVSVTGAGGISLNTAYNGDLGELNFTLNGKIAFSNNSSKLSIGGRPFTLVSSLAQLASVINSAYLCCTDVALAKDYDAAADGTYTSPPVFNTGYLDRLEGLGNAISHFKLNDSSSGVAVGLISLSGCLADCYIHGLHLKNADVTGGDKDEVGALVGAEGELGNDYVSGRVRGGASSYVGGLEGTGELTNSHSSAVVRGGDAAIVGGLAGEGTCSASSASGEVIAGKNARAGGLVGSLGCEDSFATGSVTAGSGSYVGGLVGYGGATNSYATGAVTGGSGSIVGGLAGVNQYLNTIYYSYSTGKVTGGTGSDVGGLIGSNIGDAEDTYWDTTTSGTTIGVGAGNTSGVVGLTNSQLQSGLPPGFKKKLWAENSNINNGLPYLLANSPAK